LRTGIRLSSEAPQPQFQGVPGLKGKRLPSGPLSCFPFSWRFDSYASVGRIVNTASPRGVLATPSTRHSIEPHRRARENWQEVQRSWQRHEPRCEKKRDGVAVRAYRFQRSATRPGPHLSLPACGRLPHRAAPSTLAAREVGVIYTGPGEPNLRVVDVIAFEDDDPEKFTVLVVETV
jgi:hypothetical protein